LATMPALRSSSAHLSAWDLALHFLLPGFAKLAQFCRQHSAREKKYTNTLHALSANSHKMRRAETWVDREKVWGEREKPPNERGVKDRWGCCATLF
jgi:hypothetical protein